MNEHHSNCHINRDDIIAKGKLNAFQQLYKFVKPFANGCVAGIVLKILQDLLYKRVYLKESNQVGVYDKKGILQIVKVWNPQIIQQQYFSLYILVHKLEKLDTD